MIWFVDGAQFAVQAHHVLAQHPIYACFLRKMTTDTRLALVRQWLASLPQHSSFNLDSLRPASSDASFRRYFRLDTTSASLIVMDAPPDKEDCKPFVTIATLLLQAGVNVPRILAQDLAQGFLLLSDLGQSTLLPVLLQNNQDAVAAKLQYGYASDALVKLQLATPAAQAASLPAYDAQRLMTEMQLFEQWYVQKHLGKTLTATQQQGLQAVLETLIANNTAQPQVLVHRDFHSRNLMLGLAHTPQDLGVLDFQDAVIGPITYDLVSLLRDAYIEWDEEQQLDWGIRYWEKARKAQLPVHADFGDFWRDFEWMGLQRHLKVLGIFARLYHRDGKDGYLKDLPLVMRYTRRVADRYLAFTPLIKLLDALEERQEQVGYTF